MQSHVLVLGSKGRQKTEDFFAKCPLWLIPEGLQALCTWRILGGPYVGSWWALGGGDWLEGIGRCQALTSWPYLYPISLGRVLDLSPFSLVLNLGAHRQSQKFDFWFFWCSLRWNFIQNLIWKVLLLVKKYFSWQGCGCTFFMCYTLLRRAFYSIEKQKVQKFESHIMWIELSESVSRCTFI